jgi:hypothetical protein
MVPALCLNCPWKETNVDTTIILDWIFIIMLSVLGVIIISLAIALAIAVWRIILDK